MTYRCVHVVEKSVVTYQYDLDGEEIEVEACLCALCGRWFDPREEPTKEAQTQ